MPETTKQVLRAMIARSKELADIATDGSSTAEDIEIPPNIHLTPDDDRFEDVAVGVSWMGVSRCSITHFEDAETQATIDEFVDAREHLRIQTKPDYEYTVEITTDEIEPATVVALTEAIFEEIYGLSLDESTEIEWDDIPNRERLTAAEFMSKYGT